MKLSAQNHPDVTCLGCGYRGPMGIKMPGRHIGKSAAIAALITGCLALAGFGSMIWSPALAGMLYVIALHRTATPVVTCPSCGRDLQV